MEPVKDHEQIDLGKITFKRGVSSNTIDSFVVFVKAECVQTKVLLDWTSFLKWMTGKVKIEKYRKILY